MLILVMIFCRTIFAVSLDNLTDFTRCKVSHLGLEYMGQIAVTESHIRCQNWKTDFPIHKVDSSITDDEFPERSVAKAKNFCRNPNGAALGPWCYTIDPQLIDDTCAIPLCRIHECRITGPGMEYTGNHSVSVSQRKCKRWNKKRKRVRYGDGVREQAVFRNAYFPDEDAKAAKFFCRNPDGDLGGPWCFVDVEDGKMVEKEYCNIPFCDDQNCMVFVHKQKLYTHYTQIKGSITNLTIGIKLWNSDTFLNATTKLVLSIMPLPLSSADIDALQLGVEITISNLFTGLTQNNADKDDELIETPNLLKSTEYTFFSVTWGSGFVSLSYLDSAKEIFLAEFRHKKNLLSLHKDKFLYYSMQGGNVLWTVPQCDADGVCDVHTTSSVMFERFWPMRITATGHDVQFFVRAFHSACVLLTTAPTMAYPRVQIALSLRDNRTKVLLEDDGGRTVTLLSDISTVKLIGYWEWGEFSIAVFNDALKVFVTRDTRTQIVLEVRHAFVALLRWFAVGSDGCVAHWTLFCTPMEEDAVPHAWPPECAINTAEAGYVGTQWVTSDGSACLPWSDSVHVPQEVRRNALFPDGGVLEAHNYCRDPFQEGRGTYCYARVDGAVVKTPCGVRVCKSAECRLAGTGNDYIGMLNTTRSNRTCQRWGVNHPHRVDAAFLNDSLYADQSYADAGNFCRDPSRNIVGTWCYTVDAAVPRDICNVRDCTKLEESIVLTRGNGLSKGQYARLDTTISKDWVMYNIGFGFNHGSII